MPGGAALMIYGFGINAAGANPERHTQSLETKGVLGHYGGRQFVHSFVLPMHFHSMTNHSNN